MAQIYPQIQTSENLIQSTASGTSTWYLVRLWNTWRFCCTFLRVLSLLRDITIRNIPYTNTDYISRNFTVIYDPNEIEPFRHCYLRRLLPTDLRPEPSEGPNCREDLTDFSQDIACRNDSQNEFKNLQGSIYRTVINDGINNYSVPVNTPSTT